jgi:hypothetical protein
LAALALLSGKPANAQQAGLPTHAYLPILVTLPPPYTCPTASAAQYQTIPVQPPVTDRPAAQHADLNLALRSYGPYAAALGFVYYSGGSDPDAPQLTGLFEDNPVPAFVSTQRVYNWNWACNCRGDPIQDPEITLLGLATYRGEPVYIPTRRSDIYQGTYRALVLYAEERRITLKYTRDDNVKAGYTVHLENVCVDPNLLALYRTANSQGRGQLPALRNGESLGTATGEEIRVAIRDWGSFLDPRSRKDWWQAAR